MRKNGRSLTALLLLGAVAGPPKEAQAAPCAMLPNPVYVGGSSAVGPFIKGLGQALSGTTTVVYKSIGSCVGVNTIVADATPTGACAQGGCITGTGTYYDAQGMPQTCDLDVNGTHLDVAVSDVFLDTCLGMAPPAKLVDTVGPAQAMTFVVPKASKQTAITFEEAYFAFGFGANGKATPWVNETLFFIRNQGSGTQQIVGHAIGVVPVSKMKGIDSGGSTGVLNMVVASPDAEATIGILGAESYDPNRDKLTALAFRGNHQYHAYYPDSTATAFDKRNVRDGHYLPIGYVHMAGWQDGNGNFVRPGAKFFTDFVIGASQVQGLNAIDLAIAAHTIPLCAMKVKRTADGGDFSLYQPAAPCGCYFEKLATGATTCTACQMDNQCGNGKCRNGYCEAH